MGDNASKIKKNYIASLIYQLLLIVVPIITAPYLARTLGNNQIGKYSYYYSFVTYFCLIASLGFSYYGQRAIVKNKDDKASQSAIFLELFCMKALMMCISLSIFLILVFCGVFEDRRLMLLLSFEILACAFDISFFFYGNEKFTGVVFVNVIIKVLNTVCIFLFVKSESCLNIYAIIQSLTVLISNLLMWLFLRKKLVHVSVKKLRIFRHFRPALILFIPVIAISIYRTLDKSLIGLLTHDNAQNGYYEQAEKIIRLALTIITSLGMVMISRNASLLKDNDKALVQNNLYNALRFVFMLAVPMVLGVFIISDAFIPIYLGPGYEPVPMLMKIYSFIFIIVGMSNVYGLQYFVASGKDKQYTISIICGALLNLVLNLILIPSLGALGATIGTVCAEFLITLVMVILARKVISIKTVLLNSIKYLIAGGAMAIFGFLFDYFFPPKLWLILINVLGCIVIYFLALLILRDALLLKLFDKIRIRRKKDTTSKEAIAEDALPEIELSTDKNQAHNKKE